MNDRVAQPARAGIAQIVDGTVFDEEARKRLAVGRREFLRFRRVREIGGHGFPTLPTKPFGKACRLTFEYRLVFADSISDLLAKIVGKLQHDDQAAFFAHSITGSAVFKIWPTKPVIVPICRLACMKLRPPIFIRS